MIMFPFTFLPSLHVNEQQTWNAGVLKPLRTTGTFALAAHLRICGVGKMILCLHLFLSAS